MFACSGPVYAVRCLPAPVDHYVMPWCRAWAVLSQAWSQHGGHDAYTGSPPVRCCLRRALCHSAHGARNAFLLRACLCAPVTRATRRAAGAYTRIRYRRTPAAAWAGALGGRCCRRRGRMYAAALPALAPPRILSRMNTLRGTRAGRTRCLRAVNTRPRIVGQVMPSGPPGRAILAYSSTTAVLFIVHHHLAFHATAHTRVCSAPLLK